MIKNLIQFIQSSPTPYHAVMTAEKTLIKNGFRAILFDEISSLTEGKYYLIKDDSTLIAFVLPAKIKQPDFQIIAAHTDSPNLRIRREGHLPSENGDRLSLETYGGLIYHTWLDRDLSIAGRLFVQQEDGIKSQLIHLKDPLISIPSLAIHLDRRVNENLNLNPETHLQAIFNGNGDIKDYLSDVSGCQKNILSYDLSLYDTQPPKVLGLKGELLQSARIDNLAMCHAALTALIQTPKPQNLIPMIALFDHEEVGSLSQVGADSNLLPGVIENLISSKNQFLNSMDNSFLLSADMAHAKHPNYPDKHPAFSRPHINQGVVLKINENRRYATDGRSEAYIRHLCQKNDTPLQLYHHRNDIPCGSTIGPILAGKLNIATADIGNPMWGMHSIRETCGTHDHPLMISLMEMFFQERIF